MSSEPVLESPESQPPSPSLPFPTAWWGKILYGLFLTVIPAFSFWVVPALGPEWQDGKLSSYIALLLLPEASWLFFLLLGFSIISYWFLLFSSNHFAESFTIRLGIYTGVALALHYSLLVFIYSVDSGSFILIPVWFFTILFYYLVAKRLTVPKIGNPWLWIVLVSGLIIVVIKRDNLLFLALLFLVMVAPLVSLLIALRVAFWLFEKHEAPKINVSHGLGITVWIITYAAAWRYDIMKMFELYQALPTKPPQDCYIATAAAQGHPRFVGSHPVHRADGLSMRVNGQLQHLKCAELALMAVSPRVHGVLRKIYDVAGKFLAQRMTNPFVADVAYLLLKPAEWFAIFVLRWIIPEIETIASEMYSESNVYRRSTQKSVAD